MKKILGVFIVCIFIIIAIIIYPTSSDSDGFVTIHLKNTPKWGEEFDLKYKKYSPPIDPARLKKSNKQQNDWIEAYSINSDLKKLEYDTIVKNATKDCLIERGLNSRESFDEKKRIINERLKNLPLEITHQKKYILWSSEITLNKNRYMLICTAREGYLSDSEEERKYKSLVILRYVERWRLESYKKGIDLGLVEFPWNDGKMIEEIHKQKMAEFKDGRISVTSPK